MNSRMIGIPLEGFAEFARIVAAEGAVLLKNEADILPCTQGENVSVFGRTQIEYYRSGTGSGGAVNVEYTTNLLNGLRESGRVHVNEELATLYENWLLTHPFDNGGGGWAAEPWNQEEMPVTTKIVKKAREFSEKAVVVIGRTAGEDKDNEDVEGGYRLTERETKMLQAVCQEFDQVVVVLNVGAIIDMHWAENPAWKSQIKGILYVWHGGIEGGNAAADVITGKVTPSGKLTDTIAHSIQDYPSTTNYGSETSNLYQEDIYVGYRYFETFAPEKVQYEFGFGLSYAEFDQKVSEAAVVRRQEEIILEFEVTVTNTGENEGKEVVQIYGEAPQGVLGRPARELVAFQKTHLLRPGGSQTLSFAIPLTTLATYDDSGATGHKSAYVLEAGLYRFHVGNSVRNTSVLSVEGKDGYELSSLLVVKELEEAMAPVQEYTRMRPGTRREDGTYNLEYERVPVRSVDLAARIASRLPQEYAQTGNQGIHLKDVKEEKATMEAFVAQLSDHELATLVRAEGMSSPKVTQGTASAFGGMSDSLFAYGIPVGCCADGPSGIRMESGLKATQVPIGTLLASTWNRDLVEELYVLEGKELLRNEIDSLLGPGLNIHRNPLNGRNFEYFSEDPLITGTFAAVVVKGILAGGSTATLKHFACNNQEKARSFVDSVVSERAIREIYLKGFEMAVVEGKANSIMTSYNPVNGHWAASNYDLNTTILRKEWGFDGIVMTDWWAKMNHVVEGGEATTQNTNHMVRAQNDLYMVINNNGAEVNSGNDNTEVSLLDGSLTRAELQRSAVNICKFLMHAPVFGRKQEFTEPVEVIAPVADARIEEAVSLLADTKAEPAQDKTVLLYAPDTRIYRIVVNIMSPDSNLAQSTTNVYLNDQLLTTIQTNGTDGRWILQKLGKVELKEGFYQLRLDAIKPGMQIKWIQFLEIQ